MRASVEYTHLGKTGLYISRLIFGGAQIGEAIDASRAKSSIGSAWDIGINTFYTADKYNDGQAEQIIGPILKKRRDDFVLMVKTGLRVGTDRAPLTAAERLATQGVAGVINHDELWKRGVVPTQRGLSRKHIMSAVEQSLRRLETDYIDVYVAHYWDPYTPVEETLSTFDLLIQQGKVRYIGCSQTNAWQLCRALWVSDTQGIASYSSVQTNLNILDRSPLTALVPAAAAAGVSVLAFASLAGNLLSGGPAGEYISRVTARYRSAENLEFIDRLGHTASQSGRGVGELAQAWVLAQKGVSALLIAPTEVAEFTTQERAVMHPLTYDEAKAIDALGNPGPRDRTRSDV
jgi:1-deoxyxylulose-5-phosphate synthase